MATQPNKKPVSSAVDEAGKKPPAFIFGERPETITAPVSFVRVTGEVVELECKFKYRTRREFGELWDEVSNANVPQPADGEKFSFANLADRGLEFSAERTLKYLVGWDVEIDLDKAALVQLFDEEPNAAAAFWDSYRGALVDGRVKNS
ncbi:phage tail assembly chaperone [Delftia tsuruhatensis]|uniref:phage tail assembly chaperone n=1 Tax=Delftia tsuruhatensis TaxID=180282 RepID=UPI0022610416|nr:phage tail assembly chaperone [Delftia tsuruhatensis]MCX7504514.1 phage tail assembly chaperone [Delftia tsuruhatensis]